MLQRIVCNYLFNILTVVILPTPSHQPPRSTCSKYIQISPSSFVKDISSDYGKQWIVEDFCGIVNWFPFLSPQLNNQLVLVSFKVSHPVEPHSRKCIHNQCCCISSANHSSVGSVLPSALPSVATNFTLSSRQNGRQLSLRHGLQQLIFQGLLRVHTVIDNKWSIECWMAYNVQSEWRNLLSFHLYGLWYYLSCLQWSCRRGSCRRYSQSLVPAMWAATAKGIENIQLHGFNGWSERHLIWAIDFSKKDDIWIDTFHCGNCICPKFSCRPAVAPRWQLGAPILSKIGTVD